MAHISIVDSLNSFECAALAAAHSHIATDNPFLSNSPQSKNRIANYESTLQQSDAIRLGTLALELNAEIDRLLGSDEIAARFGLEKGSIYLTGSMSRLISSLFHRGAALSQMVSIQHPKHISLFAVDAPRWEPSNPLVLARFAHPARHLAEHGFFGPVPFQFHAVPTPLPREINNTAIADIARRVSIVPATVVLLELLQGAGVRWRGKTRLVVAEENGAIREALPWLAARGLSFVRRGPLTKKLPRKEMSFSDHVPIDQPIHDLVAPAIIEVAQKTGIFTEEQSKAIASVVSQHASHALPLLAKQSTEIGRRLDEWFDGGNRILLTNGLYGPAGAQAYNLARKREIKIIEFEHGVTASIAALTQVKFRSHSLPTPDYHFVSSNRAAEAFDSSYRNAVNIKVVGLADQTRKLFYKPFQRVLARRRLSLQPTDEVIVHVSTLPMYGNHRPGLGTPTETVTWNLDRTLIEEVFSKLARSVVFKQYPTQRFPFEPAYEEVFRRSENVRFTKDEDFRYIRAAADIITTSTPTSTLGWCVGTEVPVVWLDSRLIHPLANESLRSQFEQSFFCVDLDNADWAERLRSILSMSREALMREWLARASARKELYESALVGPSGSVGQRCAAIISDIVKSSTCSSFSGPQ